MFPTLSFGDEEIRPEAMRLRAARMAGAMAAAGINEGDTIALMLRNEPALMDVMLSGRQLGVYFTPLNWHFKSDEAGYIVRDSGAKVLFAHTDFLPQIADGLPSDLPVFAIRPHPLTASTYRIPEPATRIPAGARDWQADRGKRATSCNNSGRSARHGRLYLRHDRPTERRSPPAAAAGPGAAHG